MSDQELSSMMSTQNEVAAPVASAPDASPAPDANAPEVSVAEADKVEIPHVAVADCTSVYDFVVQNAALAHGWAKVKLVKADNTEVTDTKQVLVGISDSGYPVTFDCNNLYVPTALLTGVTSIKVLISGIIIDQPNATIYVTKNNIYVYAKDATSHVRTHLEKYLKLKKDIVPQVIKNRETTVAVDAEFVKLTVKTSGGRLYTLIEDLTDLAAMKEAILKFLAEKVSDINYCIKIEDICLQLGF